MMLLDCPTLQSPWRLLTALLLELPRWFSCKVLFTRHFVGSNVEVQSHWSAPPSSGERNPFLQINRGMFASFCAPPFVYRAWAGPSSSPISLQLCLEKKMYYSTWCFLGPIHLSPSDRFQRNIEIYSQDMHQETSITHIDIYLSIFIYTYYKCHHWKLKPNINLTPHQPIRCHF